jgi:hypothetical protein
MDIEKFRIDSIEKTQIQHDIAGWERFIIRQQNAMDRMRSQNSGVRSGSISTDLAMFQISINNAENRIAALQAKLEALGDE